MEPEVIIGYLTSRQKKIKEKREEKMKKKKKKDEKMEDK